VEKMKIFICLANLCGLSRAWAGERKFGGWAQAGYETTGEKWPEAIAIIGNGLLLVFAIMALLAFVTWVVGRAVQRAGRKQTAGEAHVSELEKE